jgi:hypothetical protein
MKKLGYVLAATIALEGDVGRLSVRPKTRGRCLRRNRGSRELGNRREMSFEECVVALQVFQSIFSYHHLEIHRGIAARDLENLCDQFV